VRAEQRAALVRPDVFRAAPAPDAAGGAAASVYDGGAPHGVPSVAGSTFVPRHRSQLRSVPGGSGRLFVGNRTPLPLQLVQFGGNAPLEGGRRRAYSWCSCSRCITHRCPSCSGRW